MNLTVRELFDRYGATLAVVAVLALLVVLMPGNGSGGDEFQATSGPGAGNGNVASGPGADPNAPAVDPATGQPFDAAAGGDPAAGGGAAPAAGGPGAQAAGAPGGGADPAGTPPPANTECREDGRMPGFSFYMPPCVPVFQGDNGGATAPGVTADKILVIRYIPVITPATEAILRALGAFDDQNARTRIYQTLVRYYNTHVETYAREVVMQDYKATGEDDNDEAQRADAVAIAAKKPFAVFESSAASQVFTDEIAARKIFCFCGTTQSSSSYARNYPFVHSALPMLQEYYAQLAEYIGKRLANKPAKNAGDLPVGIRTQVRKFGLVYLEGVGRKINPGSREGFEFFKAELAKYGVQLAKTVSYTYDPTRQQEQSTNIIAQMKDAGVTTMMCVCDPLYPAFITKAATQQQYFPEHLITGTALIDTTFFGRTYDQAQWDNAFGISPLWVFFTDVSKSSGYQAYHHMRPGAPRGEEGVGINVYQAPVQALFTGIHMAGPNLNVQTMEQGYLRYPRSGGQPNAPLVYYTRQSPTAIKDFTEVFWDSTGRGVDETGKDGVGVLLKVDGGKRYEIGEWPATEPRVFDRNGAVFTSDTPPETFPHGGTHPPEQRCRSCRP